MWIYEQKTGKLFHNDDYIVTGYAGYGQGKNNPEFQSVRDIGPLPKGLYNIGAPYNSARTGGYTLTLTPDNHNEMFGRSDFRIHGDAMKVPGTASHGCIVVPLEIRHQIWASNDRELKVV